MARTEKSLESHRKDSLTTVFHALPLAILIVDDALKVRWVNRQAESLFVSKARSLIGRSVHQPESNPWTWENGLDLQKKIKSLFERGESMWGNHHQFNLLLDGGKTKHHLSVNATPFEFSGEEMALLILEKITHLRELEWKNKEIEKLGLTIQMVRATAHDLNQPLSVLVGTLDLLAAHRDTNESFKKRIDRVLGSAERVAEVVRRLQIIINSSKKREILKTGVTDSGKTSIVNQVN